MRHVCECGNPRDRGREACDECAWLDGESAGEAGLIGVLRLLGGTATSYEIADAWGVTQRTVLRMIRRLRATGRVYRYLPETRGCGVQDGAAVFILCDSREECQPWRQTMYASDRTA